VLVALTALAAMLNIARTILDQRPATQPTNPAEAIVQTLDPRTRLDDAFNVRLVYWDAAIRMSGQYPIAGVGLGRYPRLVSAFRSRWVALENAHNFFLQVLAETGLVGLVVFGTLLALSLVTLWRAADQSDTLGAGFAVGALFSAVAFAITLLTGHPLVLSSLQALWASVLALGMVGAGAGSFMMLKRWRRRSTGAPAAAVPAGAAAKAGEAALDARLDAELRNLDD